MLLTESDRTFFFSCRDGVAKPPKTRERKRSPGVVAGNSKGSGVSFLARASSNWNPFRTTNITRTAQDWEKISQAQPGYTLNMPQSDVGRSVRPMRSKNLSLSEERKDPGDLPSLEKLVDGSEAEGNQSQSQSGHRQASNSTTRDQLPGRRPLAAFDQPSEDKIQKDKSQELEKDRKFETVSEDESIQKDEEVLVGLEKFRNHKKVLEDFDERRIFNQSKEPLKLSGERSTLSQVRGFSNEPIDRMDQSSSSPSIFEPPPTKSSQDDLIGSQASTDKDETDELDEDWDIKIFEGYLAPDAEQANDSITLSQSAKRNIEQMGGREENMAPKRMKLEQMPCPVGNHQCKTVEIERRGFGDEASKTNRPKDQADSKLSPAQPVEQPQGYDRMRSRMGNSASDDNDDDDELLAMVDEVMAWAESHVVP